MTLTKAVLSTKECHAFCGSEAIFEELEAVYGSKFLKPLRTLPNYSRSWARDVVETVIQLAQSEGVLNDRPKVEKALSELRHRRLKARQEGGCSA
jgi:hypothetical protein